jgi:hypothetical protein
VATFGVLGSFRRFVNFKSENFDGTFICQKKNSKLQKVSTKKIID